MSRFSPQQPAVRDARGPSAGAPGDGLPHQMSTLLSRTLDLGSRQSWCEALGLEQPYGQAVRGPQTNPRTGANWTAPATAIESTRPCARDIFSARLTQKLTHAADFQAKSPKNGASLSSGTGTRTPNSCSRGRRVADYTIPDRSCKDSQPGLRCDSRSRRNES
jgi:hypothetical protein